MIRSLFVISLALALPTAARAELVVTAPVSLVAPQADVVVRGVQVERGSNRFVVIQVLAGRFEGTRVTVSNLGEYGPPEPLEAVLFLDRPGDDYVLVEDQYVGRWSSVKYIDGDLALGFHQRRNPGPVELVEEGTVEALLDEIDVALGRREALDREVPAPTSRAIDAAIARLGSDEWSEREAGVQELLAFGDAVEPVLREALGSAGDPEIRGRMAAVLDARRGVRGRVLRRLLGPESEAAWARLQRMMPSGLPAFDPAAPREDRLRAVLAIEARLEAYREE